MVRKRWVASIFVLFILVLLLTIGTIGCGKSIDGNSASQLSNQSPMQQFQTPKAQIPSSETDDLACIGFEGRFRVIGDYFQYLKKQQYREAYSLLHLPSYKYTYLNETTFVESQKKLEYLYGSIMRAKALSKEEIEEFLTREAQRLEQMGQNPASIARNLGDNTIYVKQERLRHTYTSPITVVPTSDGSYKVEASSCEAVWDCFLNVTSREPFKAYVEGVEVASFAAKDIHEAWYGTRSTIWRDPSFIGKVQVRYPIWYGWKHEVVLISASGKKVVVPMSGDGRRLDVQDPNEPVKL